MPSTQQNPVFGTVQPAPPDAILGLTEAFQTDPREGKINLGVGVYKDAGGATPVLDVVKQAERRILERQSTKSYKPIGGDAEYGRVTRVQLFGESHEMTDGDRAQTAHTPGGTGALRVAGDYLSKNHPGATLWLSDPTWANHAAIFQAAGVPTQSYAYYDKNTFGLDFDAMTAALSEAKPGDVVLLHGCCHNPTGVDLSLEQWQQTAALLSERGLLPLVDFAYQGFAEGIEQDAAGLRTVMEACPELLICSSYSKNFGLYNERVGALTVVTRDADTTAAVSSQVLQTIRRSYSNPPAHGGSVVHTILADDELKAQWEAELAGMRDRINGMRTALASGLDAAGVSLSPRGNGFITEQRGMFSFSGLTKEQVDRLREEHAIYIVGSGRINVAGITPDNCKTLCEAIAKVTA